MIDTHCHLFFDSLYDDLNNVIEEAKKSGIKYIICPSTDIKSAEKTINIIDKYDIVYGAVGIHPHDTKDFNDSDLKVIDELSNHKKVIAIGEIGLDYFYDYSPIEKQQEAFSKQIELAIEKNMPVIIHSRESEKDILNIYESFGRKKPKAQFHCFSGDSNMARRVVEDGSFISFTGNITYPKREDLRNIIKNVELENILLETDAPFMSPVPLRGKPNRPENLKYTVEKLAELYGLGFEDIVRTTNVNAYKLFGIGGINKIAYTYKIGNSLYVNVTNRCNADCVFCDRNGYANIKGHNLKMPKNLEPDAETYINEIGDPKNYNEIVFCGYGEPTIRVDIIKAVGWFVKNAGGKTRLNTNGHGNFINKRNILPDLSDVIDTISISLNSTNKEQYLKLMQVPDHMFEEMLTFTAEAKKYIKNVVWSVVGMSSIDISSAEEFAKKYEVPLRIREYF